MIAATYPVRGRGALSLRLGAQTFSRTGRGWVASPLASLRSAVRGQTRRCRSGMVQAPSSPTFPARGSLLPASMREVQSAKADFVPFQRRVSNPSSHPLPFPT